MGLITNLIFGRKTSDYDSGGPISQAVAKKRKKSSTRSSDVDALTLHKQDDAGDYPQYKRGGKVKRTGLAKVHKGERVLTRSQARKYSRRKGKR